MSSDSHTDSASPPHWGAPGWLLVFAVFVVGFALFPMRLVGVGFEYQPGDLGDGRLNQYILEHGYRFVSGDEPSFWSAPFWYPAPRLTAYSDAHLGTLPLYAMLRAVGLSQEAAFQGWFLLLFALNYAGWVWAARRIGLRPLGTAVGGYFFTFGIPITVIVAQHPQFGPRFLAPAGLVLAWEWWWRPSRERFLGFVICVVFQMYLTIYVGFFLVIVAVLQALVAGLCFRREVPWRAIVWPGWREWRFRVVVAGVAALTLAPLLVPYFVAGREHPYCDLGTIHGFSPEWRSWLNPAVISWHWDWTEASLPAKDEFGQSEKQLFPGLVPLIGVVLALRLIWKQRPAAGSWQAFAGIAAISSVVACVLVTRVVGISLYDPMFVLPGGNGIRVSGRIMLVGWILISVSMASATDEYWKWAARRGRVTATLFGTAVLGALIADQSTIPTDGERHADWKYVRVAVADVAERRARMKAVIARPPAATVVYAFPNPHQSDFASIALQLDVMTACQELGVPTINGWSGYPPYWWWKFTTLDEVLTWLCHSNQVSEDVRRGMIFIGEPSDEEPNLQWRWIFWQHRFRRAPRLPDTGFDAQSPVKRARFEDLTNSESDIEESAP